jgi:hypothetical protein
MAMEFKISDFATKFHEMIHGTHDDVLKITSITNPKYKNAEQMVEGARDEHEICIYDVASNLAIIKAVHTDSKIPNCGKMKYDFENKIIYLIMDVRHDFRLNEITPEMEASLFYNGLVLLFKTYEVEANNIFTELGKSVCMVLCAIKYGLLYTNGDSFDSNKLLSVYPNTIQVMLKSILKEDDITEILYNDYNFETIFNIFQDCKEEAK